MAQSGGKLRSRNLFRDAPVWAGVNDTAAVRVVGVLDSVEIAEMFVEITDELVTEDTPRSQSQVDSIDVAGEVGG